MKKMLSDLSIFIPIILAIILCSQKIWFTSIVVSGSMEPTIMTNAIILVHKCDFEDVAEGDIICYKHGDKTIVHRVVGVGQDDSGKKFVVTKGDNNSKVDSVATSEDTYTGTVVYIGNWFSKGAALIGGGDGYGDGSYHGKLEAIAKALFTVCIAISVVAIATERVSDVNSKKNKSDKEEE